MNFVFPVEEIFLASYSVEANTESEAREKLKSFFETYLTTGSQSEGSEKIVRVEVNFESANILCSTETEK